MVKRIIVSLMGAAILALINCGFLWFLLKMVETVDPHPKGLDLKGFIIFYILMLLGGWPGMYVMLRNEAKRG
jgi:hypothetical protein